jgi:16S rRNA (uracil1498-N3)-methyltransferase
MQLFYNPDISISTHKFELDGQEALHITKVLRHQTGDLIHFTNGAGGLFQAEVIDIAKRKVLFHLRDKKHIPQPGYHNLTLAVGLLKNKDRMEWLAEKATEIGIGSLIWLHTQRSERGKVRLDRIESVMIAAMKQSLQTWLPKSGVKQFDELLGDVRAESAQLVLAHERSETPYSPTLLSPDEPTVLLIGPEGGFTSEEVENVVKSGGKSLLLGSNRLRTETAALTLLQYYHLPNLYRISQTNTLNAVISE